MNHISILGHILSFLPTKYAVATCILSSRWRFVWTSLTNLCFDERLVLNPERCDRGSNGFENFVNRVLFLTHPAKIDKLSLHCSKVLYSLKFWVSSAIMRNVCEIELNLGCHPHAELPDSIYTSKALEILKLNSVFNLKIPPSGICFPSVKILHLELFELANSLIKRLFSICPVLEDLSIKIYGLYPDSVINIISPTMKRLTIRVGSLEEDERIFLICGPKNVLYHMDCKVMIKAPNLNCLYIQDGTLVPFMLHELHSVKCELNTQS